MKRTTLILLLPALVLAGCELVVDFDRTKIPTDGVDASTPPVNTPDATVEDASTVDPDASTDPDAAADPDASTDPDASIDPDASTDAGDDLDAGDAGVDAGEIP